MATTLKYRPSDLGYYTTWWLASKSSNSSQMTTLSVQNSIKSEDEAIINQQNIDQDELKLNCCIPIKRFRKKRS